MCGLRHALPLAFVALAFIACSGSDSAIGPAKPNASSSPPADTIDIDGGSPPDGTVLDGSTLDAAHDGGKDAAPDVEDPPQFCPGNAQTFTKWTLADGECLYIKGGACVPPGAGGVPNCSKLAPCGCVMACSSGSGTSPPFWTSDGAIRTPYKAIDGSPGTCP